MFLVFGKNSNGTQPALVMAGAMLFYSGIYTAPEIDPIDPWTKAISDRNWRQVIEDANWTKQISDRAWRARR